MKQKRVVFDLHSSNDTDNEDANATVVDGEEKIEQAKVWTFAESQQA